MGPAVEIVGNATALLQHRRQMDRELGDIDERPFDDALYRELDGDEYELAIRRASSPGETRPPTPRPERCPERVPWAEAALKRETSERGREGLH